LKSSSIPGIFQQSHNSVSSTRIASTSQQVRSSHCRRLRIHSRGHDRGTSKQPRKLRLASMATHRTPLHLALHRYLHRRTSATSTSIFATSTFATLQLGNSQL
jgi:hypothetical protein